MTVTALPLSPWQEAEAELKAERNKEAKEKIKKLLRERVTAEQVVKNIDVRIEALKLEMAS
jgi:hypothetical protein